MEYLLVDGYNIINAWTDLFSPEGEPLEDCRKRLLDILSNYQGYRKTYIIVVFNAHMVKESQEKQETYDHLTVVFTKEGETADNYIERFVYRLGSTHLIRVATSDYLEQTLVLNSGGVRMSARELREEVDRAGRDMKTSMDIHPVKSNSIMSHIKPELLEKLEKIRRSKF